MNDYSYGLAGLIFEFSSTGAFKETILPPSLSQEIWGSAYDASFHSVYVVSPSNFNFTTDTGSSQGFVFTISESNHVGRPVFTGDGPNAACYNPSDRSIYIPNLGDSRDAVSVVTGSRVANLSYFGAVEGFGCGVN